MNAKKFIKLVEKLKGHVFVDIGDHPEQNRRDEDRELAKAFRQAVKIHKGLKWKYLDMK